jgi:putative oxidoreductase
VVVCRGTVRTQLCYRRFSQQIPTGFLRFVRIILGIVFFAHGAQELFGWFEGPGLKQTIQAMTEHMNLPAILAFCAVGAEFLGGVGLILGLLSRMAAVGIAVIMIVAILMVHGQYGLFLNWFGDRKGHGYEYHLLAIALAIVVIVEGAGALSVDRLLYVWIGA